MAFSTLENPTAERVTMNDFTNARKRTKGASAETRRPARPRYHAGLLKDVDRLDVVVRGRTLPVEKHTEVTAPSFFNKSERCPRDALWVLHDPDHDEYHFCFRIANNLTYKLTRPMIEHFYLKTTSVDEVLACENRRDSMALVPDSYYKHLLELARLSSLRVEESVVEEEWPAPYEHSAPGGEMTRDTIDSVAAAARRALASTAQLFAEYVDEEEVVEASVDDGCEVLDDAPTPPPKRRRVIESPSPPHSPPSSPSRSPRFTPNSCQSRVSMPSSPRSLDETPRDAMRDERRDEPMEPQRSVMEWVARLHDRSPIYEPVRGDSATLDLIRDGATLTCAEFALLYENCAVLREVVMPLYVRSLAARWRMQDVEATRSRDSIVEALAFHE